MNYKLSGNMMAKWGAKATLAVMAERMGVPLGSMLVALRDALGYECAYCQAASQILKIQERLGQEKAIELISRLLEAKKTNDTEELARVTKELTGK